MNREERLAAWRAEETGQPEGWDFSDLVGRVDEDDVPWDLDATYAEDLSLAVAVLDMGTGGGEHLLRFADNLPADVVATEGWPPNVPVAREALAPAGVEVVSWPAEDESDLDQMPFDEGRFDLILNRHEGYDAGEIARVLRPGGTFITQQVGGDELGELHELMGVDPENPHVTYDRFCADLVAAGFEVTDGAEFAGNYTYADVAALVAYLQHVPWDAPGFSVDGHIDALEALHVRGPAQGEPVRLTMKRFWLRAVRR